MLTGPLILLTIKVLFLVAETQNNSAIHGIYDLCKAGVECQTTGDDTAATGGKFHLVTKCHIAGGQNEVFGGQQEEQREYAGHGELQYATCHQRGDEHEQGENTPQGAEPAHGDTGRRSQAQILGAENYCQHQPEKAVSAKYGGAENVVFLPFEVAYQHLGQTTHEDGHTDDHGIDREQADVVQV